MRENIKVEANNLPILLHLGSVLGWFGWVFFLNETLGGNAEGIRILHKAQAGIVFQYCS